MSRAKAEPLREPRTARPGRRAKLAAIRDFVDHALELAANVADRENPECGWLRPLALRVVALDPGDPARRGRRGRVPARSAATQR